jgi:hypothetical protein
MADSAVVCFVFLWNGANLFGEAPIFQGLGDLPGQLYQSYAYGVSADGNVVVGESSSGATGGPEAFR